MPWQGGPRGAGGMRAFVRSAGSALILAACAIGGAATVANGAGGDAVHTIANYPVEAIDKNAVAAKERALAEGQRAAFRSLLKRIVPVTAYKQLSRLSGVNAADLVSGVAVRSERNSATQYIASLDFSFQPDEVRQALAREGIPFVDEQAEPVVLITALRQGNPPTNSNDTGLWRRAWASLDLAHTVTPVKLEDLKPEIHADTISMLLAGDDNGLRILSGEYRTSRVLLAIAEPDTASRRMDVTLVGRDAVGPFLLKRSYRISQGDLAYASELAAVVSLGILEGRWKALKSGTSDSAGGQPVWSAGGGGYGEQVSFTAEFSNSIQWNEIRTQLLDTPGVEGMEIATMSSTNADVSLRFPGGVRGLANALGGRGLYLADQGGAWILRSTN